MARESKVQMFKLSVMCLVTALAGFLFGYDTGVISGAILFIKKEFILSTFQEELIVGMVSFGAIFGALIGGPLSDRLGRKKIVLAAALLFVISAIGLALSWSVNLLILWRFVVGFAIGVSSAIAPVYIAEMAPMSRRGALVTLNQLAITIGIPSAYIAGLTFASMGGWREMFAIAAIPAGLQFLIMIFFPESPRWMVLHGQKEKAMVVLAKFRGSREDAELELKHIEGRVEVDRSSSWLELLKPAYRPALFAGLGLTFIQQITGINTIIYYAPTIFQFAGFTSDRSAILATTWVGVVNVLMTFVAIALIDRVGRKPLLLVGLSGMVFSLIVLGFGFLFPKIFPGRAAEIVGWISVISMIFYVAFFAFSLGPNGWLINAEIYPLHVRCRAMGLATCVNWATNFIVSVSFLTLVETITKTGTFFLYALLGLWGIRFIIKHIPETKNKSLEEIEEFWHE